MLKKDKKNNTKPTAFNSDLYLKLQIVAIKEKIKTNHAKKIYIEFGGKIFDDFHASRVLPGYFPDMKFRIIKKLFRSSEIIFVVSAKDILRKRIRGDHKITYDIETVRLLNSMRKQGVLIKNIVITRMPIDEAVPKKIGNLEKKLENNGHNIYFLKEGADHVNPKKDWSLYDSTNFVPTKKK